MHCQAQFVQLRHGPSSQVLELADGQEEAVRDCEPQPAEAVRRTAERAESGARLRLRERRGARGRERDDAAELDLSAGSLVHHGRAGGSPSAPVEAHADHHRPQGGTSGDEVLSELPRIGRRKAEEPVLDGDTFACPQHDAGVTPCAKARRLGLPPGRVQADDVPGGDGLGETDLHLSTALVDAPHSADKDATMPAAATAAHLVVKACQMCRAEAARETLFKAR